MRMTRARLPLALAAHRAPAVGAAACGSDDDASSDDRPPPPTARRRHRGRRHRPDDRRAGDRRHRTRRPAPSGRQRSARGVRRPGRGRHPAPRLLPERDPRPGHHRRRHRASSQDALGATPRSRPSTFNSGTEAIEALFSGAIDASFIGPNPAINGYAKSDGEALRIVAGTTSGGASLVVREGIETAADLAGATLATPVARQHPGRRTAGLAARRGLRHRHQRRRRREHHPAGERRHARRVPVRRPRRRMGARAVGDPPRARRWRPRAGQRGRPVARRRLRHDPPDRVDGVPRRAPRRDQGPDRRARRRHRRRQRRTPQRPDRPSTPASRRSPPSRSATRRSPERGPTCDSRSTRSPRRCRVRPTTPSPWVCSSRSTWPHRASTT